MPTRMASPTLSLEKLTPYNKRLRVGDKQKMKVFSGVLADDIVRRHLHKFVQVIV